MKKIVITQSNYIPWKGYFDAINVSDEFVIYDDMQYTRRDWRNRNLIKTAQGLKWLTIPIIVKGKFFQKIRETKVSDVNWNKEHWNILNQTYSKSKCFKEVKDFVQELYMTVNSEYLTEINVHFLKGISDYLGIDKQFKFSSEFVLKEERTERLLDICLDLNGTDYYSGPAAKDYMNEQIFSDSGINIHYFNYAGYSEYEQLYPPFEHGVTILDLIFNQGDKAATFLKEK
ncbi:WbqC-like protein [Flavobacterium sp. 270]|uniref:WbqC family protein n=1 Tax=Flavobacterium sp. 270 TaxID=2512114 RepID=UPI0010664F12|nr:WbqC family protein [Flavobacterium sp. 270]TDW47138.1 WbqC-like protein [Flavobacterium sp. 270]